MEEKEKDLEKAKEVKDANTCIALGAGVGVLGATGALLSGAVCPLCVVIAPGLIGLGAYKRWKGKDQTSK